MHVPLLIAQTVYTRTSSCYLAILGLCTIAVLLVMGIQKAKEVYFA